MKAHSLPHCTFTFGSKIPELSVLAESQTIEPVSPRELLLTDNKVLVISPCFSSSVSQAVLVSYIRATTVLVSKTTKNRTKLNKSVQLLL